MPETTHSTLSRHAEALSLSDAVRDSAETIYEQALDNNLHRGHDQTALRAGALYAACRIHEEPHNATDIADTTEPRRDAVLRSTRALNSALDLPIPPQRPQPYVRRYADELDLSDTTRDTALDILSASDVGAATASGLAASALYAAATETDEDATQEELSDVAGVSTVTIRNWYTDLLAEYREEAEE